MKFAVGSALDQTYGYWSADGQWTIKHPEAELYETRTEAEKVSKHVNGDFIEEVPDEVEFRAREDTW